MDFLWTIEGFSTGAAKPPYTGLLTKEPNNIIYSRKFIGNAKKMDFLWTMEGLSTGAAKPPYTGLLTKESNNIIYSRKFS